jgi:hypothetical protein
MQIRLTMPIVIALTLACAARVRSEDAAAAKEEQENAEAQQYVQMIQPLMWRELEFIRLTCDLTPEQRPKIKAAGDKSVKLAARAFIKQQRMPQVGLSQNPAEVVRKDIAKVLQETLTKEQYAAYSAEAAKRTASRKKAAIANVVAQLDGALYLTQRQREQISQSLEANWQEDWEQWLSLWQYGGRYFPQIPDKYLTPHLSAEQTQVWQGFQKVGLGWWGGYTDRQPADDEWWDGDVAKATGKAAAVSDKPGKPDKE